MPGVMRAEELELRDCQSNLLGRYDGDGDGRNKETGGCEDVDGMGNLDWIWMMVMFVDLMMMMMMPRLDDELW